MMGSMGNILEELNNISGNYTGGDDSAEDRQGYLVLWITLASIGGFAYCACCCICAWDSIRNRSQEGRRLRHYNTFDEIDGTNVNTPNNFYPGMQQNMGSVQQDIAIENQQEGVVSSAWPESCRGLNNSRFSRFFLTNILK